MILSRNALAVMLGGGAGAVCRVMTGFAVMEKLPSGFPLGVLCVNVLGGCLLGTGFLGGFTTFSTFSLDTFLLYRSGDASLAALNIALNMVLCLCAVWGGYALLAPRPERPTAPS